MLGPQVRNFEIRAWIRRHQLSQGGAERMGALVEVATNASDPATDDDAKKWKKASL